MSFPRYPAYKDSGVEWLGAVPAHWEVKRLKAATTHNDEVLDESTTPDTEIVYVDISSVDGVSGIKMKETMPFSAAPSRARRRVRDGDVIISTVRTYLKAIARIRAPEENLIVSTGFAVIRPRSKLMPDFLGCLVSASYLIEQVIARSTGVSYPAINASELVAIPVPLPPLPEQTQIAAFLDRETAKIDELVAEQQRLMELLKEKRQAVISHAVTKGLNPDAPMKPSGIEWLGEVPAHWRVISLGRVTVSRCDGPFGSGLKSEHYTDAGVRVIRLQNIRSEGFNGSDEAFIDAEYYERELNGHDVRSGDLLIAGLGDDKNSVGRACVAPAGIEPAMVKADCFRYRLDANQAIPEFVAIELSSGAVADAGLMSSGSTRSRIPLSIMATRKLAIPPVPEQQEIANFIRTESLRFDTLTAEAQRAIDLLQERRTALISAAVTGQIDVRQLTEKQAA